MHPLVIRLTELLPPPRTAPDPQPWRQTHVALGTELPGDFRDFVDTYGYGSLDGLIGVRAPEGRGEETGLRTFYGSQRFAPWPAEGSLLLWGTTQSGHDLHWRREGEDPDAWPVAVVGHRSGTAFELAYGMAEFVFRMLGDPADRPADIPGIAGHPHSRYLDTRTEEEMDDAGEDPWEYLDDHWDAMERARAESAAVTWVHGPGRHRPDNPPVPRLTVQGFGLDGADLCISAALDIELTAPLTATVRIGGPNGDVVRRTGVPVSVSGAAVGSLLLDIRLPGSTNDTGRTWRELLHAMSHEPEWSLSVSVQDRAIGVARRRLGIVTGAGMHESALDIAVGVWP